MCVLAVLTVAWLLSEPICGKLVFGGARVLTKQIPIVLEVADHKVTGHGASLNQVYIMVANQKDLFSM